MVSNYLKTVRDTLAAYKWWADVAIRSKIGLRKKMAPSVKRHLALPVWSFPPRVHGGVYRPTALVRYGSELGWRISVLSGPASATSSPAGAYLLQTLPKQLRIGRVDPPKLGPSWNSI